ncbi:MAG: hypothetical protein ACOXZK_05015 [Bacteroidales bacterium]
MEKANKVIIVNSNILDFVRVSVIPIGVVALIVINNKECCPLINLICILVLFVTVYFLSAYFFNFYKFYEEYLEIYYPTRIRDRTKKINYSEIKKVKYYGDLWESPLIRLFTEKKCGRFNLPSNSFSSPTYKKTKKTLKFLESKGVLIKINSENKKKQRILD